MADLITVVDILYKLSVKVKWSNLSDPILSTIK